MRMGPFVVSITSVFCGSVPCASTSATEANRMRAKPSNERITERLPLGLERGFVAVPSQGCTADGANDPARVALLGQLARLVQPSSVHDDLENPFSTRT